MEALNRKRANFLNVYKALRKSIEILKNQKVVDEALHNVIIAGVIKHFELTHETAWKFLKEYLFVVDGVDAPGSRSVFRACYENKVLPKDITDVLLDLVDERNLTVHIYDMATAERICQELISYFYVFDEVAKLKIPQE